jgi:hypothetical protein
MNGLISDNNEEHVERPQLGRVLPHNLPLCEVARGALAESTDTVSDIDATNYLEYLTLATACSRPTAIGLTGCATVAWGVCVGNGRRFCLRVVGRRRCPTLTWYGTPVTSFALSISQFILTVAAVVPVFQSFHL